jgi:hypothetical protein
MGSNSSPKAASTSSAHDNRADRPSWKPKPQSSPKSPPPPPLCALHATGLLHPRELPPPPLLAPPLLVPPLLLAPLLVLARPGGARGEAELRPEETQDLPGDASAAGLDPSASPPPLRAPSAAALAACP